MNAQLSSDRTGSDDVGLTIFAHLLQHPDQLPPANEELPDRVTDYVAGMTDRFALAFVERL